jgi:hypothetical protein
MPAHMPHTPNDAAAPAARGPVRSLSACCICTCDSAAVKWHRILATLASVHGTGTVAESATAAFERDRPTVSSNELHVHGRYRPSRIDDE